MKKGENIRHLLLIQFLILIQTSLLFKLSVRSNLGIFLIGKKEELELKKKLYPKSSELKILITHQNLMKLNFS